MVITRTEDTAERLRRVVAGTVATPDDPEYESLRRGWNLTFEQRPAVVVAPRSAGDVAAAVRHAVAAGQAVAIQATGHGVARVTDGDMLVVTRDLDEVAVDDDAWTARVGAGVTWAPVLDAAQDAGLAPLLGSSTGVGAVGYTLGGGMGWLARRYGLSADRVRSFEIVTADGAVRTVSAEHDPDLFWALRGGGAGTLGVVTAMEIDLVPVADVYAGNLVYPAEMAHEVAARYRDWIAAASDDLTSSLVLMRRPDLGDAPDGAGMPAIVVRGCHTGPLGAGRSSVDEWRRWRPPAADTFGAMPFRRADSISGEPIDPVSGRATAAWLGDIGDDVIDVLADTVFRPSAPVVFAEVRHAAGAIARADETATVYGNRTAPHMLELVGSASRPAEIRHLEGVFATAMSRLGAHLTGGVYLNLMEGEERRRRTRDGFAADAWVRLQAVKRRYDPGDVFSHGFDLSG